MAALIGLCDALATLASNGSVGIAPYALLVGALVGAVLLRRMPWRVAALPVALSLDNLLGGSGVRDAVLDGVVSFLMAVLGLALATLLMRLVARHQRAPLAAALVALSSVVLLFA